MKVVLLTDMPGYGRRGELKDVSDGYAKNHLIPKKLASQATPEIQAKLAKETRELEARLVRQRAAAQALKQKLEHGLFVVRVPVGPKGQVFGGVHARHLAAAVNAKYSGALDYKQLTILGPVKSLGEYRANVKLPGGVTATVRFTVAAA